MKITRKSKKISNVNHVDFFETELNIFADLRKGEKSYIDIAKKYNTTSRKVRSIEKDHDKKIKEYLQTIKSDNINKKNIMKLLAIWNPLEEFVQLETQLKLNECIGQFINDNYLKNLISKIYEENAKYFDPLLQNFNINQVWINNFKNNCNLNNISQTKKKVPKAIQDLLTKSFFKKKQFDFEAFEISFYWKHIPGYSEKRDENFLSILLCFSKIGEFKCKPFIFYDSDKYHKGIKDFYKIGYNRPPIIWRPNTSDDCFLNETEIENYVANWFMPEIKNNSNEECNSLNKITFVVYRNGDINKHEQTNIVKLKGEKEIDVEIYNDREKLTKLRKIFLLEYLINLYNYIISNRLVALKDIHIDKAVEIISNTWRTLNCNKNILKFNQFEKDIVCVGYDKIKSIHDKANIEWKISFYDFNQFIDCVILTD